MSSLISVIIPIYNRATTIERALISVFKQSYKNWELIIVDDGSTDDSLKTINKVLTREQPPQNAKIIKTKNNGVSKARNLAAQEAQGEWLAFLDSDDEWLTQKLENQIEFAKENPLVPLIHGEEIWIRNGVRVNQMKKHKKSGGRIFKDSVLLCCISPSATLIKRNIFQEELGFNEEFVVCEDYELWLKITAKYNIGFIKEPIIKKYGGHDDQLSRKFFAMDYWRVKALKSHLFNKELSVEERSLARDTVIKKSEILLKGYKKHNNLKDFEEVFQILNDTKNTIIE